MVKLCIYCNSSLSSKDKLAKSALKAFINSNCTPTAIFNVFCILISAFAPVSGLPSMYIDINLQKTIKSALELFFKG